MAATEYGGTYMYIRPSFFATGREPAELAATLMHEALHGLGITDSQAIKGLGIQQFFEDLGNSTEAISLKLQSTCFGN